MPASAQGDRTDVLDELATAVRGAGSVDDVLSTVGQRLATSYALRRVSLRRVLPGTSDVEIVAIWSVGASRLTPGLRMPLRATTLAAVVTTGDPELGTHVAPEDGLLHQILADEGIRSYASVPLGDTAAGVPVFSLSSSRPDAFEERQRDFVVGLAQVVAAQLGKVSPVTMRPVQPPPR